MNPVALAIRSAFARPAAPGENGKKALTSMIHDSGSRTVFWNLPLPATAQDYQSAVGSGQRSSVLAGPLNWIMRNFPEAPAIVEQYDGSEWVEDPDHALIHLLKRPNSFYSGRTLLMATAADLCWGNGYWLKIRNQAGTVIQLWWAPRLTMEPVWPKDNPNIFIDHWNYRPKGPGTVVNKEIAPEDVVHFQFGADPENTRLGLSPLGALFREIATDDEAANFTSSILRNLGIIGLMLSPKGENDVVSDEEAQRVKEWVTENFGGDNRAAALVMGIPTDVNLLQYNLQGFDVSPIRDISEERVCAALGIPAAVVGFGTGLQQTKVGATMKENRQQAWLEGMRPLQNIVAEEGDRSLLPEFEPKPDLYRMRFDTDRVPGLLENAMERHDRIRKDVLAGIVDVGTAQGLMGYSIDPFRVGVYQLPQNLLQLSDGTTLAVPPPDGGTDNSGGEE